MRNDWIKKIVKHKSKQIEESFEGERHGEDRHQYFLENVPPLWAGIQESVRQALDVYNEALPGEQRVAFEVRRDDLFVAEKRHPPSGHMRIALNRDAERIICSYEYIDERGNPAYDFRAFNVNQNRWGLFLELSGRKVKEKEAVQEILADFLTRI